MNEGEGALCFGLFLSFIGFGIAAVNCWDSYYDAPAKAAGVISLFSLFSIWLILFS